MTKTFVIRLVSGLFLIIVIGVGAGIYLRRSTASAPAIVRSNQVYKDGTYSSDGTYQSPGGSESIGVTMTIAADKVTKVIVIPKTTHQNSQEFQDFFSEGVSDVVTGKPLSENFDVSKLNGSSLTGGGFTQAVEAIRSQAKS
jgi:hypothetical protein